MFIYLKINSFYKQLHIEVCQKQAFESQIIY